MIDLTRMLLCELESREALAIGSLFHVQELQPAATDRTNVVRPQTPGERRDASGKLRSRSNIPRSPITWENLVDLVRNEVLVPSIDTEE